MVRIAMEKRLLLLLEALMMCVVSAVSAESLEVKTFEDGDVQDRALSDWDGRWQSAYPFALNGSLDEAFELMAASGRMTAEEYAGVRLSATEMDGD